jgi:aspartate racemase
VQALGLSNVGLFGTRFTMQGNFYQEVFSRHGITLSVPDPDDQTIIHDKYMGELIQGMVLPETRERLLTIAGKLVQRRQIQGLILGGTELSLIFRDPAYVGIPFFDTTKIHVNKIILAMLGEPAERTSRNNLHPESLNTPRSAD